jgi:hypothetical protein
MAKKTAIYTAARSQYDPIIRDQLRKLNKSEEEIKAMLEGIEMNPQAKPDAGASGATPGVIQYNADGTRKK